MSEYTEKDLRDVLLGELDDKDVQAWVDKVVTLDFDAQCRILVAVIRTQYAPMINSNRTFIEMCRAFCADRERMFKAFDGWRNGPDAEQWVSTHCDNYIPRLQAIVDNFAEFYDSLPLATRNRVSYDDALANKRIHLDALLKQQAERKHN